MATTATLYFPYDSGAGSNVTEDQWRKMAAWFRGNGVLLGYLNSLAVTGDSTGMQVKLATGACWINGAYGENSTSVQTLPVTAAHSTNPRIDLVVARNRYNSNLIEWDVIAGTPAGSPVAPTPTIDSTMYEIPLAYIAVGAAVSTITAGNVTDIRKYSDTTMFKARRTSNQALGDLTATKIQFTTETYDVGSNFDSTTNYRFTAPATGYYRFNGGVNYAATATRGALILYVNGSPAETFADISATVVRNMSGAADLNLTAGDYVELYGFRSGAGNITEAYFCGELLRASGT